MGQVRIEDELKSALCLFRHMREMFTSGNEIPVTRIVMSREEFLSLTAPGGAGNAALTLPHHTKRQIKDLVRSAYDRGYNDARNSRATSSPRVVFRIAKLKSWGNIGGAAAHNLRTRPTPNADPAKKNIVLVGPRNGEGVVDAVKQKLDGMTIRKNAVLAVEVVISASPGYFRPSDPGRAGHWDKDRLAAWRKSTESWISRKFPHAASVVLHLDEATPHYQVIDVPINDSTGRLDARSKYGGRATLASWQTSAAKAVEHLGIERGIKGSQAKHTTLKEFYAHVNKEPAPPGDGWSGYRGQEVERDLGERCIATIEKSI